MEKQREKCVLYDRDCIGCLECEICDLIKTKFAITAVNAWISKIMQRSKSTESSPDKKAESN